jgi:hypothetical protein
VLDLRPRLGERLAHFHGQDRGKILHMQKHEVVPAPHQLASVPCGQSGPGGLNLGRPLDRGFRFLDPHVRQGGEQRTG